jgi:hypothetical protein
MVKITVVEPLPWNDHKGLYLEYEPSREPEAELTINHDGIETYIELDASDIQKLIQVLQGVLKGKEATNG